MKILKQIIKEFWAPLTLAILWVIYNVYDGNDHNVWDLKKIINVFGPTFFLLSWLTGQFFRVKKQTRVEDSFDNLELRLKSLINQVESKTQEMIGHISGGDSFPWLHIGMIDNTNDKGILTVIHQGVHPLYDVTIRIVDLQKFQKVQNNLSLSTIGFAETNINVGNMIPSHASMIQQWQLENSPEQSYNIFITARNGSFTQLLRLKKINGVWASAIKVLKENNVLHEQIDKGFPKNDDGNVLWE